MVDSAGLLRWTRDPPIKPYVFVLPQVAIMTPDMASFQTVEEAAAYSQDQDDLHPVTLLATSNGTHIAVQVGRPATYQ